MGAKNGKHKVTYPNNDVFDGNFVDGLRDGEGVYTSADGHRYEGSWKNDKRHGPGTQTFSSKGKDGKPGWSGTYEGEWFENKKHGRGIFTYVNGDRYEGQWVNGKKDGYGIYSYANQDRYEGQFSKDNIHGQGIFIYKNGDQCVGRWKNDVQDGRALHTSAGGKKREEIWENGECTKRTDIEDSNKDSSLAELSPDAVRKLKPEPTPNKSVDDLMSMASKHIEDRKAGNITSPQSAGLQSPSSTTATPQQTAPSKTNESKPTTPVSPPATASQQPVAAR
jgi:hypothetical protein